MSYASPAGTWIAVKFKWECVFDVPENTYNINIIISLRLKLRWMGCENEKKLKLNCILIDLYETSTLLNTK